ncbi:hypothetical protein DM01DRAFT_1385426 [Hesseltinella vesiculosa]|uniref:Retrotransposon gag domain-containing protein n=1 Tax=Hesseltinella vesiculosa TaxID=101127 RepID=A0A1X2GAB2_9FUNG|nr:hypothetical protein DM01DRAFT_1385426 [Hesseltinella vesiculosa]
MEETLGCSNANAESRRLKVPMPYVKANDLASWLMNFKNARDINGLSDLESIAYAKDRLTGDAYVWAARCKETTWEGFEQKLTAKFVTPSQNVREAARAVLDFNVTQGTSDLDILNSFEDHYHHFIYMTTDDSPYRKIPNDFLLGPLANAFNDDSACIKLNGLAASSKNVDDIIREMRHYLQETRSRNGNGLAVQVSSLHDQLTLLTKKLDQMTTANQQPIPAMLSSQAPPIHQRPPPQGQNYSRTPYTPHKTGAGTQRQ